VIEVILLSLRDAFRKFSAESFDDIVYDESERIWKETLVSYLSYFPSSYLEELKKTYRSFSQDC
jgi:hypothetical protein